MKKGNSNSSPHQRPPPLLLASDIFDEANKKCVSYILGVIQIGEEGNGFDGLVEKASDVATEL